jgi:hypothetical protein
MRPYLIFDVTYLEGVSELTYDLQVSFAECGRVRSDTRQIGHFKFDMSRRRFVLSKNDL